MARLDIENIKKLIADQYPPDVGLRCISVQIPDDDSYVPVLAGFVAIMGKTWAWAGTLADREERARLWQVAYAATDWDGCMTCQEIIDCITNDADTINAFNAYLLNQIMNNADIRSALTQVIQQNVGEENPYSRPGENMVYGKECNLDNLYGAIRFLVKWLNENNKDFLEKLAAGETPESVNRLIGTLFPGFQGNNLTDTTIASIASHLTGAFGTGYNANYDTVYEDALICELFCLAQANCTVSIDQLYACFSSRLSAPITVFDGFANAVSFFAAGAFTFSQLVDVMFFLQIGSFKFLSGFDDLFGISPLVTAINQGWDDPSDDWTLCDTCPEAWCRHMSGDSLRDLFTGYINAGNPPQAFWTGTGWGRNVEGFDTRLTIQFNPGFASNLTTIRAVNSEAITNGDTNTKTLYALNSSNVVVETIATSPADADVTFDVNSARQNWIIDCVSDESVFGTNIIPGEITDVYVSGYGTEPTWGEAC